jgi:glycosyltransferase involved in cell wall biosynthesis
MKIVYLAAGAADMICGSCLHDNTLVAALQKQGHDALLVPTYTPIRTDEDDVSLERVFFGGINVYLQQQADVFGRLPAPLAALLDRPGLIRAATRLAPSVDATRLGGLAVSMLRGEEGRQKRELEKLTSWLAEDARPEIVHLANAMLSGMVREIHKLGAPVVATLSGEDIFLERLPEPFYSEARQVLRERAQDVDAFVALNGYYADFMAEYLSVPRERIAVIPHGLNLEGHALAPRDATRLDSTGPRTLGYLARICPEKGLHLLVAAWQLLAADPSAPPVRLRVAGYLGAGDREYFEAILNQVASGPRAELFDYVGEVSRPEKIAFLQSLDVFSVPTVYRESKGLSVLEAWANGAPVVLPAHGAFPEMVEATAGGLLCAPDDPKALASELAKLFNDLPLARAMGARGQSAVQDRFHAGAMADETVRLYRRLIAGASGATPAPNSVASE